MSRAVSAIGEPFGRKSPVTDPAATRDFSPAAEKFPVQVLVVDDEPLIRWSVSQSLGDLGYDVTDAPDAATALKMVTTATLPFRIVVMDLRLPDMHDLSLLGTLRQLLPRAQLILMTAFGTPEVIADARSLGATVLLKPFELDELNRLVRITSSHRS
jgi:DNA-binding NtrC family response regulator